MCGGCLSPFAFYLCISAFICGCFSSISHASSSLTNEVHFCKVLDSEDMRARDSIYAATKHALNLNVGEPRTVRMIYFLPNDRPFRQEVVDSMKVTIHQIQSFYAEQMQAHGYGNQTFRFETDARGEPMVHRMDGQHPVNHYLVNIYAPVLDEIEQVFDRDANIYFTVIDIGIGTLNMQGVGGIGNRWGKSGGFAVVQTGFTDGVSFHTAAHELGHGFGLEHDFRDNAYIMSYGGGQRHSLSACNAEFLSVHPYFNPDIPIGGDSKSGFSELVEGVASPFFELISSHEYPAGSQSVSIQLKVSDLDGLHQVLLFVRTRESHPAAGSLEVKMCQGLGGETDAIVQFDYDGVIPSDSSTSLSNLVRHSIYVLAVDTEGNVQGAFFPLIEISSQLIATLKQTDSGVISVAFSPDGTTIASASNSSTVNLWDAATRTNIVTLHDGSWSIAFSPDGSILASGTKMWDLATKEHVATLGEQHRSHAIAFSPDGSIFASGSYGSNDGTIELWDVTTKQHIATLSGHGDWIFSLAFSPDGTMLASGGSGDGVINLWDVATKQHVATLSDEEVNVSGAGSIAFSPDGTILASGSGSGYTRHLLNLWDVTTKEHIATLGGGSEPVAFSPDGRTLASGSSGAGGGGINLWDVATKEHIVTLSGHTRRVQSIAFSPDGDILASGAEEDRLIKLWDISALGLGEASQVAFSLSLDVDGAAGDQEVTSLDVSPGAVVSLQIFGKDIQNADGISVRFEYDATQVLYEGFDPGDVLPNAQVLALPSTNPTAIEISLVSFGGKAAVNSGLVGSVRFLTTSAFSGTALRLVRAELGRGGQREEVTFDNTSVALQLAVLTPDFNGDGRVGFDDFVLFVGQFGLSRGDEQYDAKYDLDEDGTIGFGDFLIFGRSFGKEEKERFEPEGLVLIDSGNRFFRYFQGQIDASGGRVGHLRVPNGGFTAKWSIVFLDHDGDEIDPPDEPDFKFTATIADPTIVEVYQAPTDVGKFEFQLRGLKVGETTIVLEVTRDDHIDFRTVPIFVRVVDQ